MKFKKALLPFITGALVLGLAACSGEDKAEKNETPKDQEPLQKEMKIRRRDTSEVSQTASGV